jgi:hypothetical protein
MFYSSFMGRLDSSLANGDFIRADIWANMVDSLHSLHGAFHSWDRSHIPNLELLHANRFDNLNLLFAPEESPDTGTFFNQCPDHAPSSLPSCTCDKDHVLFQVDLIPNIQYPIHNI